MKYTETRDKAYYAQKQKEYRQRRKGTVRANAKYYYRKSRDKLIPYRVEKRRERIKNDPLYAFKIKLYAKFRQRLKAENDSIIEIVGCSVFDLYVHLNKTRIERYGKNWSTMRKYEIDHIIPLESATTEEEIRKLWHYANLQYLTRTDNRSKGCKISQSVPRETQP